MAKIFYDTEFLEDGERIHLISIGMVAEDGRELYAVNRDMPVKLIAKHSWLMANVVPYLPRLHGDARLHAGRRNPLALDWQHRDIKSRARIADEVRDFIVATPDVELWAWYGAYDHVALAWLYGPMSQLPEGIPMWTNDLKQEAARLGNPEMPEQASGLHNALADARHNKVMAEFLASVSAPEGGDPDA
ncbi:3'-5' exoribonuclease [Microtetraspora sp. AC03309]|uniref:3'-5' exoribonuclease n=1 Tax=Microtetraspora sp. AC03309 TaxID=2779376 RepID=UPI001E328264|nr:3'-5' exoribonuclease [Microtetraspora sp. AC03309]MCC5574528.1 3'-5' exoribonuclease [Microtetraspora sp. AC03309]